MILREGMDNVDVPEFPAVKLGEFGRSVDIVAKEACGFRDAFDVLFVHADTGGRGLVRGLANRADAYCSAIGELCGWREDRCITITPCHETEAWLIADGVAVTSALGYLGDPGEVGLPANARAAERLNDPKRVLKAAAEAITGRRRPQQIDTIFPAIAQRQNLERLRRSSSFAQFEDRLRVCLRSIGCIR